MSPRHRSCHQNSLLHNAYEYRDHHKHVVNSTDARFVSQNGNLKSGQGIFNSPGVRFNLPNDHFVSRSWHLRDTFDRSSSTDGIFKSQDRVFGFGISISALPKASFSLWMESLCLWILTSDV